MECEHGPVGKVAVLYRLTPNLGRDIMTSADIERLYREHQPMLIRWLARVVRCQEYFYSGGGSRASAAFAGAPLTFLGSLKLEFH